MLTDMEMREFGECHTRKRVLDAWDCIEQGDLAWGCMNLPRQTSHATRGSVIRGIHMQCELS